MTEKNPLPEEWVAEFLRRHDEGVLELDSKRLALKFQPSTV
jgi:hypothetical protein